VAERLGVSKRTVRALADRGDLRRVKLSTRATRYELTEVEAFIAERTAPLNDACPVEEPGTVTTSAGQGRHGGT
jgi:excisionase family DNA binding protein